MTPSWRFAKIGTSQSLSFQRPWPRIWSLWLDLVLFLSSQSSVPRLCNWAANQCILLSVATLVVFIPDLVGPAPSWVYYSFAIGLFLYQTFDSAYLTKSRATGDQNDRHPFNVDVDGRQARRTRSSSALGISSSNMRAFSVFNAFLRSHFWSYNRHFEHTPKWTYPNRLSWSWKFSAGGLYGACWSLANVARRFRLSHSAQVLTLQLIQSTWEGKNFVFIPVQGGVSVVR